MFTGGLSMVVKYPIGFTLATIVAFDLCGTAHAACDDLVDRLITSKLKPVIEDLDCSVVKNLGVDKKDHKLVGVCYESTGPTSKIRIDTQLHCQGSDKSVVSQIVGKHNIPSVSENVTVMAEARGSDCKVTDTQVKPSGELGKALASLFDANGKARDALQQGLTEACGK
jgi:hypothetical protein